MEVERARKEEKRRSRRSGDLSGVGGEGKRSSWGKRRSGGGGVNGGVNGMTGAGAGAQEQVLKPIQSESAREGEGEKAGAGSGG